MRFQSILLAFTLLATVPALARSKPATCSAGEIWSRGKCVKACPTEGAFPDADSCECPSGFGKVISGTGGGQCSRILCPMNSDFDAKKDCTCPEKFEKHKGRKKGQERCILKS